MVLSVCGRPVDGDESCAILALAGEIDIATYQVLRVSLNDLRKDRIRRIVADFSDVTYCDSTGIGVLATVAKSLIDAGGWLQVAGLRPAVAEIFGIAGLTSVIPTFPTVELALANAAQPTD
jgi:anti-sigma B factor antagonist